MKSYGKLFEKVIDFENLWRAYRRARKGKRLRPDVATFEFGVPFTKDRGCDRIPLRCWIPRVKRVQEQVGWGEVGFSGEGW
jgi:hypothetical protein